MRNSAIAGLAAFNLEYFRRAEWCPEASLVIPAALRASAAAPRGSFRGSSDGAGGPRRCPSWTLAPREPCVGWTRRLGLRGTRTPSVWQCWSADVPRRPGPSVHRQATEPTLETGSPSCRQQRGARTPQTDTARLESTRARQPTGAVAVERVPLSGWLGPALSPPRPLDPPSVAIRRPRRSPPPRIVHRDRLRSERTATSATRRWHRPKPPLAKRTDRPFATAHHLPNRSASAQSDLQTMRSSSTQALG